VRTTALVPRNYDELLDTYWEYVKALVAKHGVTDTEDAAGTIILKFYEKGMLEEFRPNADFETPVGIRRSNFRGFLTGFVNLYVRQDLDKQATLSRKVPHRLEEPAGSDGGMFIEVLGAKAAGSDDYELLEFTELVLDIRAHLKTLPVRGKTDLLFVFDTYLEHSFADGECSRKDVAKALGVGTTSITQMRRKLEDEVRKVLATR